MVLMSFYDNDNKKLVFSEVESKDVRLVVGLIFKLIAKDNFNIDKFDSKLIFVDKSELKTKELNKKIKCAINNDGSSELLSVFEDLASEYEESYIFDMYEGYKYTTDYSDLSSNDYELHVCDCCRNYYVHGALGYCSECFVDVGVQKIFEDVKNSIDEELYTEYETISKPINILEEFFDAIKPFWDIAKEKAKEITNEYVGTLGEATAKTIIELDLGGF